MQENSSPKPREKNKQVVILPTFGVLVILKPYKHESPTSAASAEPEAVMLGRALLVLFGAVAAVGWMGI